MAKTPAITDEFEAFAKMDAKRVGPKCPICKAPADIRALVEAKLAADTKKSTLERFLKSKGYAISAAAMRTHVQDHIS